MADGKNLMEERKNENVSFLSLNLKLNNELEASNTKWRARTCHKRNNNSLKHQKLFPADLLQQHHNCPTAHTMLLKDRNHTLPWVDSLTEDAPNPLIGKWATQSPSQWNLCHFQETTPEKRLKFIYPLSLAGHASCDDKQDFLSSISVWQRGVPSPWEGSIILWHQHGAACFQGLSVP